MGCSASAQIAGKNDDQSVGHKLVPTATRRNLPEKLVLLGDSGVGKSSVLQRLMGKEFDPYAMTATVGAAFVMKTLEVPGHSSTVKLEIWDTAGQERFAALAPIYYRAAAAAVVMYDISSPETFHRAQFWVDQLHVGGCTGIVMALVGNKADIQQSYRRVAVATAEAYAARHRMFFIETSAKTAQNVCELFQEIGKRLITRSLCATHPI